ncbi:WD40-repeat-containing domain protein [Melampsora americana]|nr:WD40-repeat-containing domain protein [Melampsora americana]
MDPLTISNDSSPSASRSEGEVVGELPISGSTRSIISFIKAINPINLSFPFNHTHTLESIDEPNQSIKIEQALHQHQPLIPSFISTLFDQLPSLFNSQNQPESITERVERREDEIKNQLSNPTSSSTHPSPSTSSKQITKTINPSTPPTAPPSLQSSISSSTTSTSTSVSGHQSISIYSPPTTISNHSSHSNSLQHTPIAHSKLFRRDPSKSSTSSTSSILGTKTRAALAKLRIRPTSLILSGSAQSQSPTSTPKHSHHSLSSTSMCRSERSSSYTSSLSSNTHKSSLKVKVNRTRNRRSSSSHQNLIGLHLSNVLLADPNGNRSLWTLEFAPAPLNILATAGQSKIIYLFELDSKSNQPTKQLIGHTDTITSLAWTKSGKFLISASMDKTVRVWDVESGLEVKQCIHTDFVTSISSDPNDENYFLSGSIDRKLRLWNLLDSKVVAWTGLPDCITSVGFSNSNTASLAYAGLYSGKVTSFNPRTLKIVKEVIKGPGRKVSSIVGIEDQEVLIATNDSRIRISDQNAKIKETLTGHKSQSGQLKPSIGLGMGHNDADLVVSGSEDGRVYVWELGLDQRGFHESFKVGKDVSGSSELVITCAVFRPKGTIMNQDSNSIEIAVVDDRSGLIRIFKTALWKQ